MRVRISGVGAWGPGFTDWASLSERFAGDVGDAPVSDKPSPDCIPPRERRRAPLSVKLAVEVAQQACQASGIAPSEAACVFASGMGDMQITEYMCETLASDMPAVSPTKFHNSVHNAAVGYWSISQGAKLSSNAVAGFDLTVSASLLEAITQCVAEGTPVLWASQDIVSPGPFRDIADIPDTCAFALMLEPAEDEGTQSDLWEVQVAAPDTQTDWPALRASALTALYETNPTARLLPLLEAMTGDGSDAVSLPLNQTLTLEVARA